MRTSLLKLLLLATFAFWATGTAKYVHEITAHGGGLAVDHDDDGDADASPAVAAGHPPASSFPHHHHPCPVCQLLAAMAVGRLPPAVLPAPPLGAAEAVTVAAVLAPPVHPGFTYPATGPPAGLPAA